MKVAVAKVDRAVFVHAIHQSAAEVSGKIVARTLRDRDRLAAENEAGAGLYVWLQAPIWQEDQTKTCRVDRGPIRVLAHRRDLLTGRCVGGTERTYNLVLYRVSDRHRFKQIFVRHTFR